MANARCTYSRAEEIALATQVDGCCPLCSKPLFYSKTERLFKDYELAHIYPLNPRPDEVLELQGVVQLSADVNHPDNLIPLCNSCHTRYDKPRTREEYEKLAAIKRKASERAMQRTIFTGYALEAEIGQIVSSLPGILPNENSQVSLEFDAKCLDRKFDATLPAAVQQKIRHNVSDYYQYVRSAFRELERQNPGVTELIFSQVRSYYLKQEKLGLCQVAVFTNTVEWIRLKTSTDSLEAAEIMVSFFIQNCEVFR